MDFCPKEFTEKLLQFLFETTCTSNFKNANLSVFKENKKPQNNFSNICLFIYFSFISFLHFINILFYLLFNSRNFCNFKSSLICLFT